MSLPYRPPFKHKKINPTFINVLYKIYTLFYKIEIVALFMDFKFSTLCQGKQHIYHKFPHKYLKPREYDYILYSKIFLNIYTWLNVVLWRNFNWENDLKFNNIIWFIYLENVILY